MPPVGKYSSAPAPGTEPAEEAVSMEGIAFELDDRRFVCHGLLDAQDMMDLAGPLMDAGDGWLDPEAIAAVGTFYRRILGPETYRAFAAHRRRMRTPSETVAQIMLDLVQEATRRPPGSLSPSPDGPPSTGDSSPAASPPGSSPEPEPEPGRTAERTIRLPAAEAADPEGIIPREMAHLAEVTVAPPLPPNWMPPDPMAGRHRVINLGRPPDQVRFAEDDPGDAAAS
jgi:hypothetical protein